MKTVAVIGQGFVGGSLTTVLAEKGAKVYAYDKAGKMATGGQKPFVPNEFGMRTHQYYPKNLTDFIWACEDDKSFSGIYFVCLPTPMNADGTADLTIVEGVLKELAGIPGSRLAVLKSTVPPRSTETWNKMFEKAGLRVIFNPEFLREATALEDMRHQQRIILGGPRPQINKVKQFFEAVFPDVPIIKTSSTTAEMVKYVTNIHLAVKVSLANEFYQICQALDEQGSDVDYDKVIEYATQDERLGKTHWKVPGPMGSSITGEPVMGFGGSCFVKDLNAMIAFSEDYLGVRPSVMKAAWAKNLEVRPERDWEKLVGRAISAKKEVK